MGAIPDARKVVVLGLGRFGGGAGAARFWAKRGAEVIVVDQADPSTLAESVASLDGLGIRFVLGGGEAPEIDDARTVVVNPAVPPGHPLLVRARAAGAWITTEIALAWRLCRGPVLAVTGSNGKSTTAALAWEILRRLRPDARLGGNIGGSLLDQGPAAPGAPTVLELSSFQLHYLEPERPAPAVAAVTNLTPNHLDWHGAEDRYGAAKRNLLRFQTPADAAFTAAGDARLERWMSDGDLPGRIFRTAVDPALAAALRAEGAHCVYLDGSRRVRVYENGSDRPVADLSGLLLPGAHNRANALQAAALVWDWWRRFGKPEPAPEGIGRFAAAVAEAAKTFPGLPHRLEWIGVDGAGRRWINDSKATTPEASALAIGAFAEEALSLVAGGYDKGSDFGDWARAAQRGLTAATLLGASAPRLEAALADARAARPAGMPPLAVRNVGADFAEAAREAARQCPPGGVVLLSPGCASWDMFSHFEERGERFRALFSREFSKVGMAMEGLPP